MEQRPERLPEQDPRFVEVEERRWVRESRIEGLEPNLAKSIK